MQEKIKEPDSFTKTVVIPQLIKIVNECMSEDDAFFRLKQHIQVINFESDVYESEMEHLNKLLLVINEAEPFI